MTELAYLPDMDSAYVRSFRARVQALPPGAVVLDRTYFYPTGGGQPADRGQLRALGETPAGAVEVTDVSKSGSAVVHRVRGSPASLAALRVGGEVEGTVDWERRHRHMRLHTAQHYLSARIFTRVGRKTRRASLKDLGASLDLDGPLSEADRDALRTDIEELRLRPRDVRIRHVSRSEWEREPAARSGLVPLPPNVDPIRVIEIDGIDRCPCGGTHVRSTGEVGRVDFLPPDSAPGGEERIRFRLVEAGSPTPTPPG